MDKLQQVIADNDQDRAEADAWFRSASGEEKIRIWMKLQTVHKNSDDEVISRLAQLAFAEAAERHARATG